MSKIETTQLTQDLSICRILNGMWQVSGGHGQIDHDSAINQMLEYAENGFNTWDMADIYGPAESLYGDFRNELRKRKESNELGKIQGFTKFVPNPGPMSNSIVTHYIEESLKKMNVNCIDLLQFHWWDYQDSSYLDALKHLSKLQNEGKISIKTPCQLESVDGDKNIKSILIKFDDGKTEKIKTDIILSFFGLVMKLGPIAEWGLSMNKKTIEVNSENFETNKKGIFAVGDICSYPGKLKLILSGFHEVALASVECFKRARPNEKYRFEFTTSSKSIQDRLGKK